MILLDKHFKNDLKLLLKQLDSIIHITKFIISTIKSIIIIFELMERNIKRI